jgi:hypothetical protein
MELGGVMDTLVGVAASLHACVCQAWLVFTFWSAASFEHHIASSPTVFFPKHT